MYLLTTQIHRLEIRFFLEREKKKRSKNRIYIFKNGNPTKPDLSGQRLEFIAIIDLLKTR